MPSKTIKLGSLTIGNIAATSKKYRDKQIILERSYVLEHANPIYLFGREKPIRHSYLYGIIKGRRSVANPGATLIDLALLIILVST
jgi:hypothetical protein